jgi:hypothetical protein
MGIRASKAVRGAQCDGRLRAPQVEANLAVNYLIPLKPTYFPVNCRQRFKDLRALLTQTPLYSKIRYEDRKITPAQAKRAAKQILLLYVHVSGGL